MEFNHLITHRYSVRKYKNTPIENQKIIKVLKAARLAPSAVNYQPWHLVVVTGPEILSKLHTSYHRDWFKDAPAVIVACADHSQSWKRGIDGKDFADIDVAITIDHLTLQAANLGLGTCWVCNFDPQKCSEAIKLPDYVEPVAMIPIGYPAEDKVPEKKRKPLEEIVHWEHW